MKRTLVYIFILLVINSCKSQNNKTHFENLFENVTTFNSFPIVTKEYPSNYSSVELKEDDYYKYFKLTKNDIYYIEEFYNYDEDIRTFGNKKPCFPIIRFKGISSTYI